MKKITPKLLLLSLTACALVACNANKDDTPEVEIAAELQGDKSVVAKIDGTNIYTSQFASYVKTRTRQELSELNPALKEQVLDEYIQLELLNRTGQMKGLHKTSDYKLNVSNLQKNLLAQAVLEMDDKNNPITEEAVLAEYNKLKPELEKPEFKARHILLKTEEDANAIIKQLDKGADFEKLAKEKSTGPSGPNGGDLGWFTADRMVPPFSKATAELEVGKYSKTPVQTQFGFHVILKEGEKPSEAPPIDNLRPRIEQQIKQERVSAFLDKLKADANIEKILTTEEEVKPAEIIEEAKPDEAVK